MRDGRRLAVTSGGHCLEGFVSDPAVRVIVDVSPMKRVYYDPEKAAVAVEAGATVGETFRALFETWGIVIPLGEFPDIGMGGHVAGGAFGFLCRQLGLAADYLYGVEVVTVDEAGRASSVVAERERRRTRYRDLGGRIPASERRRRQFRVGPAVTGLRRARGKPARIPPRCCLARRRSMTTFKAEWNWDDIDQPSFLRTSPGTTTRIWCERNSDADSPGAYLWTLLVTFIESRFGKIIVRGVSTAGVAAERLMDDLPGGARRRACLRRAAASSGGMSWLEFALNPLPDSVRRAAERGQRQGEGRVGPHEKRVHADSPRIDAWPTIT